MGRVGFGSEVVFLSSHDAKIKNVVLTKNIYFKKTKNIIICLLARYGPLDCNQMNIVFFATVPEHVFH